MCKTIFLINFFLLLFFKAVAQTGYLSDSMYVISGNENYQGKADLSGRTKVSSNGEKIIIEIEIVDDQVIVDPVYTLSDRVEIWYSLPEAKETFESKYFYKIDSTKQQPSMKFYSMETLQKLSIDTSKSTPVFYGKVQYAFVPDNRPVIWLSKENYHLFEKATGEKPGHINQGVQYKAERNKFGYKLTITLSPLGLGFIKIPSMDEICLRIDFVDIDKGGMQSRLSTTKNGSKICKPFKLSKALKTNVTTVPNYIYDSLHYAPTLIFNEKGYWSGVERKEACLDTNCLEKEIMYIRTPIGYKKWTVGNVELEKISKMYYKCQVSDTSCFLDGEQQEYYFIGRKKYESARWIHSNEWQFKGLTKEVALPDGNLGILLFNISQIDSCKKATLKQMHLVKFRAGKAIDLLKVVQDDCHMIGRVGDISIPDYKVEKIYWQKEGVVLIVEGRVPTIGPRKFKVTFLGDKALVAEIKTKK